MDLLAIVLASDGIVEAEGNGVPAWMFGVGTVLTLVLLLFIVSRMNIDR